MQRRAFVGAALSLAARPVWADDKPMRFSVTGAMTQGSLALGSAPPGSLVALDGRPLSVTADGRFAFGFGPDQTKAALVTVRYPDGGGDSRSFTPTPRQYEVQRVNGLPQKTVTPPPEVEARIAHEAETIYLARLTDGPGTDFLSGFDWPAPGIESGVFGSQRIDNGVPMAPHYGVDMAAPVGTPIQAPADGVVSISDDYYLDGGFTLIDHGQGVSTSYLHQSKRLVRVGEAVKRGQRIGLIGATGRATGPHLHWAMNWFEVRLDPSLSTRKPKPDPL
ncbi:MAG TPA: M23 family metallopeptidase [Rhizomicrobium sp.]|jgi:murein DD-endopeptidase MepM/ murein hydrolase activator NlpD